MRVRHNDQKHIMGQSQSSYTPAGCAAPLAVLTSLWPGIMQLTKEQQSKYADGVCVTLASSPSFCKQQLVLLRNMPTFSPVNSTGVGNMAYLALHASEEQRHEFEMMYDSMMSHVAALH